MKQATRKPEVLDQELLEQLLLASVPVAPAPDRAAAMKRRVLEAARTERAAAGRHYVTVPSGTGQWIDYAPRVRIKVLHSDGRYNSVLVRMAPGASLPAHSHEDDEECMVLEGEVYLGDIRVQAGDYHLALKGSQHGKVRSDTGALLFLRTTQSASAYAGN